MIGKYQIVIENAKIKYDFSLKRNITIIRGNSATGKTTLIELIQEHFEKKEKSGISIKSEKKCRILTDGDWELILKNTKDSIIFIDENNDFIKTKEFANAVKNSDNYYVIITRESLPNLPYSVNEIYGIQESGKYLNLKKTYNTFYNIYGEQTNNNLFEPEVVITEDRKSGYEFFDFICMENGKTCKTADGKSNVFKMISNENKKALVIVDAAAFGSEMQYVADQIRFNKNIQLYLPESFEWIILKSNVLKDNAIASILDEPYNYIDSSKYFSWERYFTDLLTEKTNGTYLSYTKRKLNQIYTQKEVADKILNVMDKIKFRGK